MELKECKVEVTVGRRNKTVEALEGRRELLTTDRQEEEGMEESSVPMI